MPYSPFAGRECPVCGHALRMVLTDAGLIWVCPVCGEVRDILGVSLAELFRAVA